MRIRTITFLFIVFLLSSSLTVDVIASGCVPACTGECKKCQDGVCVDDDDLCDGCETCTSGSCDYECLIDYCCYNDGCWGDCPTGWCCDDGQCVSSCPTGKCCDDDECVSSCPSGKCCDDGDCVSSCPTCYKCVDGSCEPCKCWDDGDPITGSITVQNAKICEQVTHTSSISDTDYWSLGGGGEGYPSDTISSYTWSKTAGDNPETGTFISDTDEATVTWQAPPCKGTVIIKVDADDAPDSMDNPCPGCDRDDPNEAFEGTSTVSLPTGCDDCTEPPLILLALNPEPSFDPSDCQHGGCGYIDKPTNLDIFIETPCYDGCTWRFGVTAIADVYYGPCLDDGNYTPIETGDDPDLTEENYCEIVDGFDYTPSDESTGTGCSCVGAIGPGCESGTQYSNTNCLMQHEEGHYDDQEDALAAEEDLLAFNPALDDMQIDCSDPDSKTCTDAFNAREAAIILAVEEAYEYCIVCNEEVARAAAEDCFSELANEICVYAASQGWTECDECD